MPFVMCDCVADIGCYVFLLTETVIDAQRHFTLVVLLLSNSSSSSVTQLPALPVNSIIDHWQLGQFFSFSGHSRLEFEPSSITFFLCVGTHLIRILLPTPG